MKKKGTAELKTSRQKKSRRQQKTKAQKYCGNFCVICGKIKINILSTWKKAKVVVILVHKRRTIGLIVMAAC